MKQGNTTDKATQGTSTGANGAPSPIAEPRVAQKHRNSALLHRLGGMLRERAEQLDRERDELLRGHGLRDQLESVVEARRDPVKQTPAVLVRWLDYLLMLAESVADPDIRIRNHVTRADDLELLEVMRWDQDTRHRMGSSEHILGLARLLAAAYRSGRSMAAWTIEPHAGLDDHGQPESGWLARHEGGAGWVVVVESVHGPQVHDLRGVAPRGNGFVHSGPPPVWELLLALRGAAAPLPTRRALVSGTDDELIKRTGELLREAAEIVGGGSEVYEGREWRALQAELALRGLPRFGDVNYWPHGHSDNPPEHIVRQTYELHCDWREWVCSTKHGHWVDLVGGWRAVVAPMPTGEAGSPTAILCVPERVLVLACEVKDAEAVGWNELAAFAADLEDLGVDVASALGVCVAEIEAARQDRTA